MRYLFYILIPFLLIGCDKAGMHKFYGENIEIRWASQVPDFNFLSKEETRDIATKLCNERFNSSSVSFIKRTWGNWNDYDYYQCDAPKAEISPREISDDSDSIANAKQKCLNRGLQTGTEEFGECVLKLSK